MSNIHGLGSARPSGDERKEGSEEFGVGNGQAVARPTDDLLRHARAQAAAAGAGGGAAAGGANVAEIVLYANGFRVNDSPFRDLAEPENAAFLAELKEGVVPAGLEEEVRAKFGPQVREVGVNLVDRSRETFNPPPPKFDFGLSEGRSLGAGAAAEVADFASATPREAVVDAGSPTATVQLVFHDRKRVRAQFNRSHTVLDVYRHVQAVSGHAGPFSLYAGFPPKQLVDPSATIEAAKLHGASVEQRLPK